MILDLKVLKELPERGDLRDQPDLRGDAGTTSWNGITDKPELLTKAQTIAKIQEAFNALVNGNEVAW